ncbi:MAG: type II secretion system F family protein [Oscillospiraceae bacterium]|jgi:type IV pilus assembly protein PilC|nr:type II secretion system F family protein [Oscillospiraceae bacterium]
MKSFSYTARDASGKTVNGVLTAETPIDFEDKVRAKGLRVVNFTESDSQTKKTLHKFKTKELAFNCRQLAAMLTSGLTLVRALDILYKEQPTEKTKQIWLDIYENVQKGQTFSDSLSMQDGAFPPLLISMIAAGESSGSLDVIMQRMSDHYAKENKLNNKVKGAMVYPIILLVLTVAVVLVLFTFVMPTFAGMFDNPDDMPALTKVMMGLSDFVRTRWYVLLAITLVLVFGFTYGLKVPAVRIKWDRFILKIPMIGKLIVKVYIARFARTMSSLYSSGIPMVECLQRSSAILGNAYILSKFTENVIPEVKQGEPLSAALQRADCFESMFYSIIFVGEESGALDEILEKTSDYYDDESDAAIQRMVSMLEPVMIIVLGVIVGLVVGSVLPALYGSLDNIS